MLGLHDLARDGVPANPSANDASSVELGVKFRSDVGGSITGIRFYKGTANTGTHVGQPVVDARGPRWPR